MIKNLFINLYRFIHNESTEQNSNLHDGFIPIIQNNIIMYKEVICIRLNLYLFLTVLLKYNILHINNDKPITLWKITLLH
ncbi:Hypothetical protein ERWE_CDS_02430 [Ehrlichia ruminantium str. Welgevonden]|uniref:Uncharacterized protein n=1 Tax=Ehrlichia ruminantium (strain Welgevonden) TaxID=254945 RepID=A0A0H3LZD1_EHRRW|nr:Hypothetical protein ERWE_CDS_02430 [Ehrlichia ruminantium str. Welgevonden]